MINPREILRGRAIMQRGFGIDPVAAEQAVFHHLWEKMPHLFPVLSDKVKADVDAIIAKETNELLAQ